MPNEQKPHHLTGRMGRNANAFKPKTVRRMDSIRIRVNTDEVKRYQRAADAANKTLSLWMRDTLNLHS